MNKVTHVDYLYDFATDLVAGDPKTTAWRTLRNEIQASSLRMKGAKLYGDWREECDHLEVLLDRMMELAGVPREQR